LRALFKYINKFVTVLILILDLARRYW
jgi:hypothetical protein